MVFYYFEKIFAVPFSTNSLYYKPKITQFEQDQASLAGLLVFLGVLEFGFTFLDFLSIGTKTGS
jgi:hypothetical protein